jgi:hypothetical protein
VRRRLDGDGHGRCAAVPHAIGDIPVIAGRRRRYSDLHRDDLPHSFSDPSNGHPDIDEHRLSLGGDRDHHTRREYGDRDHHAGDEHGDRIRRGWRRAVLIASC